MNDRPDLDLPSLARDVTSLCHDAGRAILNVYGPPERPWNGEDAGEVAKEDGSPLTRADTASHEILAAGLAKLTPDVPVLSEEGTDAGAEARASWTTFWSVDPLDGTKEFLKRNGEFTVNVALVQRDPHGHGVPVLGVVHLPVGDATYVGVPGHGAWREDHANPSSDHRSDHRTELRTTSPTKNTPVRIIASRSHRNPATDAFIQGLEDRVGPVDLTSSGSSLKLCRVAEGAAHYYPRAAPTMEWDTAAAHAIVTAAGGTVWRYGTREPLTYGKADLLNPHFLVTYGPDAPLPDAYWDAPTRTPDPEETP